MSEWNVVVTDTADRTRAFAEVFGLRPRRLLNGACQLSGRIRLDSSAAGELEVGNRVIKAYRDGVLRFRGRVAAPLTHTPSWMQFTAWDPWWHLSWRRFQVEELVGAATAGEALAAVITTQNARKPTHLRVSATDQSVAIGDHIYAEDAVVADALIADLCTIDNGVWLRIDPVDDDPDIWGEIAVLTPAPGVDRPGVRFEYGDETLGNVVDYELQHDLPRNFIRATGASFGAAAEFAIYGATEPEAIASQTEYGLYDHSVAFTDEDDETSLDAHAKDAAKLTPPRTWALTPSSDADPGRNGVHVPMLWDDFDIGDTGRGRILDGALDDAATIRIVEATVDVADGSGRETLAGLTVEAL